MNRSTATTRSKAGNIALWILQVALAAEFVVNAGAGKLLGSEQSVQLFADIGAGQWFRYLTGALEVAGGLGLLVPRLSGLAALGLVGVMAGAIVTDAFIVDDSVVVPVILLVAVAVVAWFRRDRTLALVRSIRSPAAT